MPSQAAEKSPVVRLAAFSTTALAALIVFAALQPATHAATKKSTKTAMVAKPAEISGCTGCHAADLAGRKGFSPSLHASGALKEYNKKTFEAVMDTGTTPDGGMVSKPMPTYHYAAKTSDAIYAYLKSLK